jgi:hypothetical protein
MKKNHIQFLLDNLNCNAVSIPATIREYTYTNDIRRHGLCGGGIPFKHAWPARLTSFSR